MLFIIYCAKVEKLLDSPYLAGLTVRFMIKMRIATEIVQKR